MIFWLVVAALVAVYVGRVLLARRGRASFCSGAECVTLALRLKQTKRGRGWKHGFARRMGTYVEWRAEHKRGPGADLTFDLNDLHVTEHRAVRRGETMLSHLCELVYVTYRGEPMELGIPQTELETFLAWTA